MRKTFRQSFLPTLLLGLAGSPLSAIAQDNTNGVYSELELGAIFTSGNTEDENIKLKGSVAWLRDA